MSEFNDLIYALQYQKAYDEHKKDINENLESLYSMLQESFATGFAAGKEAGFSDGVINTNIKMLIRLVELTDMSDEDILKVLDKKGDSLYIGKLEELRNDE